MKTLKRRRAQAKTDYRARLALLKSGMPRLVVRKTNRYIICQIIETEITQDKVIASATSKELLEKGWPENMKGSLKSLQASYLTGFLLVKKLKTKPKEAVLDIGMQRSVHNSRIFAALNGAVDAGLKIMHSKEAFPQEERLNTGKIQINKIKEKL